MELKLIIMVLLTIFSEDINNKTKLVLLCITSFVLINIGFAQKQTDSLNNKKSNINLVLGVKLFNTNAAPEIRMASNIGADIYIFKNKKISISYRNFFSTFITADDSVYNKNNRFLSTSNSISFCYQVPIKQNYIKFGLGPYHAREQTFIDQYFILIDPNDYGLEFSLYTKLRWINIGYRHQIQLANKNNIYLGINEIYRFSLCIEIPINIK